MKSFILLLATVVITGCSNLKVVDKPSINGTESPVRLMIKEQEGSAPTVLISHGSACVTPGEYMWADMLHSWGYNAVVIDHCSLRNVWPHTLRALPKNLQNHDRINDYIAVNSWLNEQQWHNGKTGLIGFSRGGESVVHLATTDYYVKHFGFDEGYNEFISAAVAFYPGCTLQSSPLIESPFPFLLIGGMKDQTTPIGFCDAYHRSIRNETLTNINVVVYEGAGHGFDRSGPRIMIKGKVTREYDHRSAV
jgi:dienelactone hydrolase